LATMSPTKQSKAMKYQTGDTVTIKPWAELEKICVYKDGDGALVFAPRSFWYTHYEAALPKSREVVLGGELTDGDFSWDYIRSIPVKAIEMCIDFPEPDDQNRAEMWGYLKLAEIALAEGLE